MTKYTVGDTVSVIIVGEVIRTSNYDDNTFDIITEGRRIMITMNDGVVVLAHKNDPSNDPIGTVRHAKGYGWHLIKVRENRHSETPWVKTGSELIGLSNETVRLDANYRDMRPVGVLPSYEGS